MKINRLHAIIGFLLIVVPLLGFGRLIKDWTTIAFGAVIFYLAMRSIHEEIMKKHHKHRRHDAFVESKPKDVRERVGRPVYGSEQKPAAMPPEANLEDTSVTNESNNNQI